MATLVPSGKMVQGHVLIVIGQLYSQAYLEGGGIVDGCSIYCQGRWFVRFRVRLLLVTGLLYTQAYLEGGGGGDVGGGEQEVRELDPNLASLLTHDAYGSMNGEILESSELQVRA